MPRCTECRALVDSQCTAFTRAVELLKRPLPPPPLGACMLPIVEDYLTLIQRGQRVLEIGCGSWDWIKAHCEKVGAHYEAIDADREYFGRPTIATRIENLAALSFGDNEFDFVIGNQSAHLWCFHGCTLPWGLYQCFRVCKTGGRVLMNVPVYYQGPPEFMLGQLDRLRRHFEAFSTQVRFNEWGNPCTPLPAYYPYPGYWELKDKPAYVLDIHAVKDRALPSGYNNAGAASGQVGRLKNYAWSYNFYRVLRRFGIVGRV